MNKGRSLFELISEEIMKEKPEALRATMMGYPALRIDDKAIIAFTDESLIVIFQGRPSDEMIQKGLLEPFDPLKDGKPLPGWFKSPFIRKDYWEELAFAALRSWNF